METAAKKALEQQRKATPECHVNKFTTKQSENTLCFRCGKRSHNPTECWFKEKECRQCHRKEYRKCVKQNQLRRREEHLQKETQR